MVIYRLIANGSFEPKEIEVMTAAYESALLDLGFADRDYPLTEMVARAIVTITDLGERGPNKIKEKALRAIGVPRTIGDAAQASNSGKPLRHQTPLAAGFRCGDGKPAT
jgi:hypothetical protein